MTREEFEGLVERLDEQAKQHPKRYRLKVVLLALGANLVVGALALLPALLLGLCVAFTAPDIPAPAIAAVIGALLWIAFKTVWVKLPPPTGLALHAAQAPELFRMIRALQRELNAPSLHRVLLTDDFNAAVVQRPRCGMLFRPRNHLVIGLPLMKALTTDQFNAVLAHELAHLAGAHGRFANWACRQRRRWMQLSQALDGAPRHISSLFKSRLQRYTSYFNAHTLPLTRAHEYHADAASARLTSPRIAAEALTSVSVIGSYLYEKYWPRIHQKIADHPAMSFAPYSAITHAVANELDSESALQWLARAMARQTACDDGHPALADRLKHIGAMPQIRFPKFHEAADRLLGEARYKYADRLDARWTKRITQARGVQLKTPESLKDKRMTAA